MDEILKFLSANSTAMNVFLILVSLFVVTIILMYVIAFFQGREITFWPPKIGEKPTREQESVYAISENQQSETPLDNRLSDSYSSKSTYEDFQERRNLAAIQDAAMIHYEEKRISQATSEFQKALKIDPNDAWSLKYLAECYRLSDQYRLALECINQALAINKEDAYSYKVRGHIFFNTGENDKALRDFQKVLEYEEESAWLLSMIAETYLRKRIFTTAIDYASQAIDIDPKHVFSYMVRGNAYYKINDYDRAIVDLKYALELDPEREWASKQLKKAVDEQKAHQNNL